MARLCLGSVDADDVLDAVSSRISFVFLIKSLVFTLHMLGQASKPHNCLEAASASHLFFASCILLGGHSSSLLRENVLRAGNAAVRLFVKVGIVGLTPCVASFLLHNLNLIKSAVNLIQISARALVRGLARGLARALARELFC